MRYRIETASICAKIRYDIYVLFDELGIQIITDSGRLGYIQPHKFFQAQFGKAARNLLAPNLDKIIDFGHNLIFGQEATTYTCLIFLSKIPRRKFEYARVDQNLAKSYKLATYLQVDLEFIELLKPDGEEPWVFGTKFDIKLLSHLEEVSFTLDEFTEKIFVGLQTSSDAVYFLDMRKQIRQGLVRAYSSASKREIEIETTFIKPLLRGKDVSRYAPLDPATWVIFPYDISSDSPELIEKNVIESRSPRLWEYLKEHEDVLRQRENGKMDHDEWWGYIYPKNLCDFEQRKLITPDIVGKGELTIDFGYNYHTTTVYSIILKASVDIKLPYILSILNSQLFWFFLTKTGTLLRGGYLRFKTAYLEPAPIRRIHFTTPEVKREGLAAELIALYEQEVTGTSEVPVTWGPLLARVEALLPVDENGEFLAFKEGASGAEEKSDVVHDLLAHLAEEMIALNKAKQARVDSFWDDLETVTAPADFDELRNRGKWEQSLAKDAACVPYVDSESRSTKHIDESLGWDEACFHAFAGMLIGKSSLTPKMTAVYRQHHAPYKELVARIEATDDLIDQVVYRLYGLTEEEIGVVSG